MRDFLPGLFGNDAAKLRIGLAIENKTLAHAFLICGPEGSGKTTLALEMAAAVNCENKNDPRHSLPCHSCNTCRRIRSGGFVDIKFLERKGDKQTIGVSEIRDYREDMFLSSSESDHKIYIIKDADKMTPNAQNALLKVLEEPPQGVLILLLSQTEDGILTTIKSRTQHVSMQRFNSDEIIRYLEKSGKIISSTQNHKDLFMCADGRIGRALLLLMEGGEGATAMRKTTEGIILALKQNTPYSSLYSAIRALPSRKDEFCEAIENIISAIRDLIVIKNAPDAPLLFYSDRSSAREISDSLTAKRLMGIYDIMNDALLDARRNVNIAAVTTSLGAKIKLI